jgi:hypothetical protein
MTVRRKKRLSTIFVVQVSFRSFFSCESNSKVQTFVSMLDARKKGGGEDKKGRKKGNKR